MRFSVNFTSILLFSLLAIIVSADSNSAEQLLSDDVNSNSTDATDGKVTIEEQYFEDNVTVSTSGTKGPTGSTILPTTSGVKTTTPKSGKPRGPSFAGWSFFIGIIVAFLLIGIAVFLFKFFCQRRATGNNVPYTPYQ